MNGTATCLPAWRPGPRVATALFMALVAAILGIVPGWTTCSGCWVLFAWLVLACIVAGSLALAIAALVGGDWPTLRFEGRQASSVALLMLAMVPLHDLHAWSDLIISGPELLARADASARAGGPPLSMTVDAPDAQGMRSGLAYDRQGIIAPRFRQAVSWRDDPVVVALSGDCIVERHLIGPWYRWEDDCEAP